MNEQPIKPGSIIVVAAAIGFAVGYLVADDAKSNDLNRLRRQLDELRSEMSMALPHVQSASRPGNRSLLVRKGPGDENPGHPAPPPSPPEISRQRETQFFSNIVANASEVSSHYYSELLSSLGLTSLQVEHFKSNLAALHHGAIEAGGTMERLLRQRHTYDREIRTALGEQGYQIYREFEESKPALREYAKLQTFCADIRNVELDPAYRDQIVALIKRTEAATSADWHGPYDPAPRPVYGREAVLQKLAQDAHDLKVKSSGLAEMARGLDLPPGYVELLADYYAAKLQEYARQQEVVSRPLEEEMRETLRWIDEEAKKAR